MAPSAIVLPRSLPGEPIAREMDICDIQQVIRAFAETAQRAEKETKEMRGNAYLSFFCGIGQCVNIHFRGLTQQFLTISKVV